MKYTHPSVEADAKWRESILKNGENPKALAALIDHTLLKMDATSEQFVKAYREAIQCQFRAVCIPGSAIELIYNRDDANKALAGDSPFICTVVGFPQGNSSSQAKVQETSSALQLGANEFDYVQNIGWVRDGQWEKLTNQAKDVVCAAQGHVVKVILETSLLNEQEIYNSALAAARGGVHVLKTSTGFGSRGASTDDLKVLGQVVAEFEKSTGLRLGIKASGGIRTAADALTMIRFGATRLGTSAGVGIVNGLSNSANENY